jgi:FKBP-type peptidyl-prolyl cis-trans isomerase SlyD
LCQWRRRNVAAARPPRARGDGGIGEARRKRPSDDYSDGPRAGCATIAITRRGILATERVPRSASLFSDDRHANLANTVVTLTFELFDSDGVLLESTSEPITYLHGGHSGMLPKLEEALNLKKAGDAISVDVEPRTVRRLRSGARQARGRRQASEGHRGRHAIRSAHERRRRARQRHGVHGDRHRRRQGVLDGNHPWAGKRLRFDCHVLEVRSATAEEVEHGHVHGPARTTH